jgi:putative transposase
MLNAEMDHHLGGEAEEETGNHRNGYGAKTVLTDTGKLGAVDLSGISCLSQWLLISQ